MDECDGSASRETKALVGRIEEDNRIKCERLGQETKRPRDKEQKTSNSTKVKKQKYKKSKTEGLLVVPSRVKFTFLLVIFVLETAISSQSRIVTKPHRCTLVDNSER